MELKIDLLPKKRRSNFTLLMGLISIALPVIYFITNKLSDEELSGSFLPIMVYLGLNGINGIVGGLGYSIEKLFGTAYVHIDEEQIVVKSKLMTKGQSFLWGNIKSLEYKTNWYKIIDKNDLHSKLLLSDLEFKVLVETRDAINSIAAEKGIATT
jgi:hypothetical protein